MIHRNLCGSIAVLSMSHGRANALDLEILTRLRQVLENEVKEESNGVVLTGSGNIFSAGVDLFRFLDDGPPYIRKTIRALKECLRAIFLFPKPLVAAINGHAIAGGCLLALAADYRVMCDDSGKIGVPELNFGVPLPSVLYELLRYKVPQNHHHEVIVRAGTYPASRALELELIDELVSSDFLTQRAVDECTQMGQIRPEVFAIAKKQKCRPILAAFKEAESDFDDEIIDVLTSDATLAAIRVYMERTVGRRAPRAKSA